MADYALSQFSRFYLISVAEQLIFDPYMVACLKRGDSHKMAHIIINIMVVAIKYLFLIFIVIN